MKQRIKLWWRYAPAEMGSSLFIAAMVAVTVAAFLLGLALWA
jgi:hypothetical protein